MREAMHVVSWGHPGVTAVQVGHPDWDERLDTSPKREMLHDFPRKV